MAGSPGSKISKTKTQYGVVTVATPSDPNQPAAAYGHTVHHHHRSRTAQHQKEQKIDVSRNIFIACFFFGIIAFCLDISSKITISKEAYDFLVYFIGIFTANYMVRKGTDAWSQTKQPVDPSFYAAPPQPGVSPIPSLQVPPQPGAQ
jgi:hypothetical protein